MDHHVELAVKTLQQNPGDAKAAENFKHSIDDYIDDIIEGLAPKLVDSVREQEVDEDIDEFFEGVKQAGMDKFSSYEMARDIGSFESLLRQYKRTETEDFIEGYEYGWKRGVDLRTYKSAEELPDELRDELVSVAIDTFDDRITEESIIAAMQEAWHHLNPMNILRALGKAIKERDWKLFLKLALFELFEHYVLPTVLVSLTGNPAFMALAAIPIGEVLIPIYLAMVGGGEKGPDIPGHYDWYRDRRAGTDLKESKVYKLNESQTRLFVQAVLNG